MDGWQGTRRRFLSLGSAGLPALLAGLRAGEARAAGGLAGLPHFAPRAKRVIWMVMSGGPSQLDLFDPKPGLAAREGQPLPPSVRGEQRLTSMTATQATLPVVPSPWRFQQHGQSGAWVSELLPETARIADRLCFLKAMWTDPINHDPAMTLMNTGAQQPGRPCAGAWISHALGSEAEELPAFVVLINKNHSPDAQPLYSRLWGPGFLPSRHQGVRLRSGAEPVLYLSDGTGGSQAARELLLQRRAELDRLHQQQTGDPEIETRTQAYALALRMQSSMPELADLSREPESVRALYGPEASVPGTHSYNCLLARRLVERGARLVQIYHRDWDHHVAVNQRIPRVCAEVDRGSAALVEDLAQRGLLEDTLVIWGGEFGRTVYAQVPGSDFGRDHHPRCFTLWMAGGGVRPGLSYGSTDDFSYNVTSGAVHVHDLHATVLHLLGIDHTRLSVRYLGRDFRLTDVGGRVVQEILTDG